MSSSDPVRCRYIGRFKLWNAYHLGGACAQHAPNPGSQDVSQDFRRDHLSCGPFSYHQPLINIVASICWPKSSTLFGSRHPRSAIVSSPSVYFDEHSQYEMYSLIFIDIIAGFRLEIAQNGAPTPRRRRCERKAFEAQATTSRIARPPAFATVACWPKQMCRSWQTIPGRQLSVSSAADGTQHGVFL
jgi:hypothetical protein